MMDKLPQKTDEIPPSFIDAKDRIESRLAPMPLHEDLRAYESYAKIQRADRDRQKLATIEQDMTRLFFGETNGRMCRRVNISGPAYTSDNIHANEIPEFVELSHESSVLLGIVLIEKSEPLNRHFETAFMAENMDSTEFYYFPFHQTQRLEYATMSLDAEMMQDILASMAGRQEFTQSLPQFQDGTNADRKRMMTIDKFAMEHRLRENDVLYDNGGTVYDVTTGLYYVIPEGMSENEIDLNVFNSTFGGTYNDRELQTISGVFTGVTFPLLEQPNLVNSTGIVAAGVEIDPYEPCLEFSGKHKTSRGEIQCSYLIPRSQLKDVC